MRDGTVAHRVNAHVLEATIWFDHINQQLVASDPDIPEISPAVNFGMRPEWGSFRIGRPNLGSECFQSLWFYLMG